jgi:hypothetical protein
MIAEATSAWYCGIGVGAVVGGVAACILLHRKAGKAIGLEMDKRTLKRLLGALEEAECKYRETVCHFSCEHPLATRAWDRMKMAGTEARVHLYWMDRPEQ